MIFSGAFGGVRGVLVCPTTEGGGRRGRNRRQWTAWDFREKPELLSLAKISAGLRERKGWIKMKKNKSVLSLIGR